MELFEIKTENMINSVYKNIRELCELCVSNGINNCYDLMDILEKLDYDKLFDNEGVRL